MTRVTTEYRASLHAYNYGAGIPVYRCVRIPVYTIMSKYSSATGVEECAHVLNTALDDVYHFGCSDVGNSFGWQSSLKSAEFAKKAIDAGVLGIEEISDAVHKGWNETARAFVKDPHQFDDTATMAPEKLQAKLTARKTLMDQDYALLSEEEKEKDRVVARAILQTLSKVNEEDAPSVSDSSKYTLKDAVIKVLAMNAVLEKLKRKS